MRKEASLPVRLDPDEKRQLQEIAEKLGTNLSALLRLLVSSFVEYYEREGGQITLPLKWNDILQKHISATAAGKAAEKPISYLQRKSRLPKP